MSIIDYRSLDLADTRGCPLESCCEVCGAAGDLAVATVTLSRLGVACVTLCRGTPRTGPCRPPRWAPRPGWPARTPATSGSTWTRWPPR